MSTLFVEAPGFLTTVQDAGRPGFAALGVSASGAADPIALALGNRLVGNLPDAAALELTLVGGRFRLETASTVAIAGADASASAGGRRLAPWCAHAVRAGETVACGPLSSGARSYLCVRGGLDVPLLFGSASTHLASRIGGLGGRALRAGDRVAIGRRFAGDPVEGPIDPRSIPSYASAGPFRTTPGPQADSFAPEALRTFQETAWAVTEACDRMGIRLEGAPLEYRDDREILTEGVPLGSVQVPREGGPIVLFVEHQTTGGYPKIACVIGADLARLGQLRPRNRLRFAMVEQAFARAESLRQEQVVRDIIGS